MHHQIVLSVAIKQTGVIYFSLVQSVQGALSRLFPPNGHLFWNNRALLKGVKPDWVAQIHTLNVGGCHSH